MKTFNVISEHDGNDEFQVEADNFNDAMRGALNALGWGVYYLPEGEDGETPAPEPARSHWEDVPGCPASDWQYEVANGDTRLGYADWAASKIEADEAYESAIAKAEGRAE